MSNCSLNHEIMNTLEPHDTSPEHAELREPSPGRLLLELVDHLIKNRSIDSLLLLHAALVRFILDSTVDDEVSFIELAEYVDLAIQHLSQGASAAMVQALPLRTLLTRDTC